MKVWKIKWGKNKTNNNKKIARQMLLSPMLFMEIINIVIVFQVYGLLV